MKREPDKVVPAAATGPGRLVVGWISGAALLFTLAGCRTVTSAPPSFTPVANETANLAQPVSAPTSPPVADFAIPLLPEPVADPTRPWSELTAIWFYYRSAKLMGTESDRIAEVVRYTTQHPDAEVGINRPADVSGIEPDNDDVNRRRVGSIRDALIRGGVSPVRIHVGTFEGGPPSINRLVVVFVRGGR